MEKHKAEIEILFAEMYEDWSAGRITEYNFHMLSEKYQNEQKELDEKIWQFHEAMETATQTAADAEKWVELMKQYVNPTELTAEFLNTLVEIHYTTFNSADEAYESAKGGFWKRYAACLNDELERVNLLIGREEERPIVYIDEIIMEEVKRIFQLEFCNRRHSWIVL